MRDLYNSFNARDPSTGLRFFTVNDPLCHLDMACFSFANKLVKGETIEIFNYGNCKSDFIYIDDIVDYIIKVMSNPPCKKMERMVYQSIHIRSITFVITIQKTY